MILEAETARSDTTARAVDRRRPGRMAAFATLVPLLRDPAAADPAEDAFAERWAPRQPARPPRGMALAVALCMPIWVALGGLLYSFAQ